VPFFGLKSKTVLMKSIKLDLIVLSDHCSRNGNLTFWAKLVETRTPFQPIWKLEHTFKSSVEIGRMNILVICLFLMIARVGCLSLTRKRQSAYKLNGNMKKSTSEVMNMKSIEISIDDLSSPVTSTFLQDHLQQ